VRVECSEAERVRCFRRLCAGLSVSGWVLRSEAHAGDRVREVAGVEVFERSFSTPVEILVTRQCVSPESSLRIASL
jgi:hypothetical protein